MPRPKRRHPAASRDTETFITRERRDYMDTILGLLAIAVIGWYFLAKKNPEKFASFLRPPYGKNAASSVWWRSSSSAASARRCTSRRLRPLRRRPSRLMMRHRNPPIRKNPATTTSWLSSRSPTGPASMKLVPKAS